MGHEEKELCKAANFAMILIIKTATDIMGTKEVFIIMNDKFKKLLNLFLLTLLLESMPISDNAIFS